MVSYFRDVWEPAVSILLPTVGIVRLEFGTFFTFISNYYGAGANFAMVPKNTMKVLWDKGVSAGAYAEKRGP